MNKINKYIYEMHWLLGFIEQPLSDLVEGKPYEIRYVKGTPKDRWFADPFILDYNEATIQVLVEEYAYNVRRGRIAHLTIDRHTYQLLSYKILLDLPTHLSFPFVERVDGHIYIMPENSASGGWHKYEYVSTSGHLKKVETIVKEPLTDAIRVRMFDEPVVFATRLPSPNGNVLSVYTADGNLESEITFDSNIARNAGDWFVVGDKVYRPAQDCNGAYGKAVIIQEVDCGHDGKYHFHDVRRIISTHKRFTTGCHTLNHFKDLIVVDVHGYRRPFLAETRNRIRKLLLGR